MLKSILNPTTNLRELHNVVSVFFDNIEAKASINAIPFPKWFDEVFVSTDLKTKFNNVFEEYKSIPVKATRNKIIDAYYELNQIEKLCTEIPFKDFNEKDSLKTITGVSTAKFWEHLENLFDSLYNSYLEYHEFENRTEINTSVKKYIDDFNRLNKITICPFCGIEGITRTEGQQRTSLDHWLCKSKFPFSSVNFDNLVPLGNNCNGRGVKGSKNVLLDNNIRKSALYPYLDHQSFKIEFNFIKEPRRPEDYNFNNWILVISPNNPSELELLVNWKQIFNIETRFNSYLELTVFIHWEETYKEFIMVSSTLSFAENLVDFRETLVQFKNTFPRHKRDGSILYCAFLEFLIQRASNNYLNSLMINLNQDK